MKLLLITICLSLGAQTTIYAVNSDKWYLFSIPNALFVAAVSLIFAETKKRKICPHFLRGSTSKNYCRLRFVTMPNSLVKNLGEQVTCNGIVNNHCDRFRSNNVIRRLYEFSVTKRKTSY